MALITNVCQLKKLTSSSEASFYLPSIENSQLTSEWTIKQKLGEKRLSMPSGNDQKSIPLPTK